MSGGPLSSAVTLSGLREPMGIGLLSYAGQAVEPGRFTPPELQRVLSYYDLGALLSARPLVRGAPDAPKVVVEAGERKYLVKRRSPGADDPLFVAAGHAVTLHLLERGYPAPAIIGTRHDNNSMLQLGRNVYEVFEFIEGEPFDGSAAEASQAGRALAHLHGLLATCHLGYEVRVGSYHRSEAVEAALARAAARFLGQAGAHREAERLLELYRTYADEIDGRGFAGLSHQLVHGDWHPGNLIFRGGELAAVVDFESPLRAPRIVDVASGALQFSLGADASGLAMDRLRLRAFLEGYRSHPDGGILEAERRMLVGLMAQSLIAEAAVPVAATGKFGPFEGGEFLRWVRRGVQWLGEHADELTGLVSA